MIVLDAAALVDLVTLRPDAAWVMSKVASDDMATAGHQLAEVVSAVARLARADELGPDPTIPVRDAASLPQDVHQLDGDLLERALQLADRIRVVDGLYVALAERLDAPLVTTNRRLAASEPPCEVVVPAD